MAQHTHARGAGRLQLRAVAAELDHVAVARFRADEDAAPGQRPAVPARQAQVVLHRCDPVARLQAPPPFLPPPPAQQQVRQVERGPGVAGVDVQRAAVARFGLARAARADERHAPVRQQRRRLLHVRRRVRVHVQRGVGAVLRRQQRAQVHPGLRLVRRERDGAAVVAFGGSRVAAGRERECEVGVEGSGVGIERQRGAQVGGGGGDVARVEVGTGGVEQGFGGRHGEVVVRAILADAGSMPAAGRAEDTAVTLRYNHGLRAARRTGSCLPHTVSLLPMIVLGVESSCDETGLALYDTERGLLSHALHSQVAMHEEYGGVVPELASRDHIRRALPLLEQVLARADLPMERIDAIAYTQGPGLAGALLVGSSVACSLALALDKPVLGVHHLEGHLLSPLLATERPEFPFVALLVSGGHTQLMRVDGVGRYTLLGETLDDAAGEAFDKSAKLLGLGYPGGPAISRLAEFGDPEAYKLPRPMLHSKDFNFSFSGLKTAVLTVVKNQGSDLANVCEQDKANIARGFVDAIVDVLTHKCVLALKHTGLKRLVIAGGVGANRQLRASLNAAAAKKRFKVYYPELEFCTDNGAMIAFAGALRLERNPAAAQRDYGFNVRPRWPLDEIEPA